MAKLIGYGLVYAKKAGEGGRRPTSDSDCVQSPSVPGDCRRQLTGEYKGGRRPTSDSDCVQSPSVPSARRRRVMGDHNYGGGIIA
ncbi:MAG: hypothetical protein LBN04_02450 [Oscillospiraceae bacterium]|nr:hypothetical protein [Oscillospiraceae bacterium]